MPDEPDELAGVAPDEDEDVDEDEDEEVELSEPDEPPAGEDPEPESDDVLAALAFPEPLVDERLSVL